MWWVLCIIIAIAFPPAIIPMAVVIIIGVLKSKNETVINNNYKPEVNKHKISSSYDNSDEHKNDSNENLVILYHGKEYNNLQFANAFLEGDNAKALGVMMVLLDKGQAKLLKQKSVEEKIPNSNNNE